MPNLPLQMSENAKSTRMGFSLASKEHNIYTIKISELFCSAKAATVSNVKKIANNFKKRYAAAKTKHRHWIQSMVLREIA